MRRLAALTVVALLAAAPAATAHPTYHYAGGCYLLAATRTIDPSPTRLSGVLAVAAVAETSNFAPAPGATIAATCTLRRNGTEVAHASSTGTTVAAAASEFIVTALPSDLLTVCWTITVETDAHTGCDPVSTAQVLPPQVTNTAGPVLRGLLDPLLCPLFARLVGVPGVVETNAQGDLFVLGRSLYDCAPYGDNSGVLDSGFLVVAQYVPPETIPPIM